MTPVSNKVSAGNFFEDFRLGQVLHHPIPRTVTEGEIALYIALTGARQIVPSSAPAAQSLGYPARPVDDLLAFHIAFGNTVCDISVNARANLGYADVRFIAPVYVGDTLATQSEVIGLKQVSSGKAGVVYVRSTAYNQKHEMVLSWIRWVMVHQRDLSAPIPESYVPELPPYVTPEHISIPPFLNTKGFDTRLTGSAFLWNDYAIGERINHPSGMTVSNTDHTLATKLYQNNARLHFDAVMMRDSTFGQRLMYGGHIISICRALSFEGLENALSLVSINAGTHTNPSFGGDTFYAYSEVLDKWTVAERADIGILRLRLVGLRNATADSISSPYTQDITDSKLNYRAEVVLDLDYSVLMPRRI